MIASRNIVVVRPGSGQPSGSSHR